MMRLLFTILHLCPDSWRWPRGDGAGRASGNGFVAAGRYRANGHCVGKRPVFAGACKACPWGVLAAITRDAIAPYGYDVKVCWVCWSNFGPREMADKTKPVIPTDASSNPYVEPPPDAVPDISATSEINLIDAWNGEGAYAKDEKQRRSYRIVAVVQQPNFFLMAASRKSGITDLAQVKDRSQPTWIATTTHDSVLDTVLAYYGITEAGLKAKGGGFLNTSDREKRAAADVFIGGGLLVDTPEQRMWWPRQAS